MYPSPLADIRIVSIEQFGAGPWATLQLADLGAEVIKIEDPTTGGDVGRYVPPYQAGEDSLFFETVNRNKKSVSLDLRNPGAQDVFRKLAAASDAVFCNLRGDSPSRLGLTYEHLRSVNPRIVCCSLSGYGMTGPRAAEGGYDYVIQGLAGWMSLTGEPAAPPTKSGISLVDLSGGYVAALTLLGAVWRARRDGIGCDCDVSLFETALAELFYVGTWALTAGYVPERYGGSAHPSIVPFQNFQTADGWMVVAAPKQKFWERLCMAIDMPDLLDDPAYADFQARYENRARLVGLLSDTFSGQPTSHWVERLRSANVPCGPINDVAAALADDQIAARGGLVSFEHPTLGTVRQVATPLRVSGSAPPVCRAPLRGEHTRVLLASLCGLDDSEIDELEQLGAFG